MSYEPEVAVAVIGMAGFQLLQAWNANAPSLQELRDASPSDHAIKNKLYDADFLVGGIAVALGIAFAVLTKDITALILMLSMFGAISVWHHQVLAA